MSRISRTDFELLKRFLCLHLIQLLMKVKSVEFSSIETKRQQQQQLHRQFILEVVLLKSSMTKLFACKYDNNNNKLIEYNQVPKYTTIVLYTTKYIMHSIRIKTKNVGMWKHPHLTTSQSTNQPTQHVLLLVVTSVTVMLLIAILLLLTAVV